MIGLGWARVPKAYSRGLGLRGVTRCVQPGCWAPVAGEGRVVGLCEVCGSFAGMLDRQVEMMTRPAPRKVEQEQ